MPAGDGTRSPFEYPTELHTRRHSPSTDLKKNSDFKPFLRDEFVFSCVYCLARDTWQWDPGATGVEHWHPKSKFPEEATSYPNLLHTCNYCNRVKGNEVPKESWHPERTAPFGKHMRILETGWIEALTRKGGAIIKALQLNRDPLPDRRRFYILSYSQWIKDRDDPNRRDVADELLRRAFGFPNDMPELPTDEGGHDPYSKREGLPPFY